MATESTYNVIKVQQLRAISSASGNDEIIINDVDSTPLETKKITAENFAYSIKDYILPIASAEILGGIKVGQGLTINPATGVLRNDIYYINDLHDVQVVSPQVNQILTYNGVNWTNSENSSVTEIIAGDGLSGGGNGGSIILNVNPGDGISIENDRVNVNTGLGLKVQSDVLLVDVNDSLAFQGNKLSVNPGTAILIDEFGVSVNYGRGLTLFGPALEPDLGEGLAFKDLKIAVDITENLRFQFGKLDVPFASEALDENPIPDIRVGGIIKTATVEQALEGTDKLDAITSYTLQAKIDEGPDFSNTVPVRFIVEIEQGTSIVQCINNPDFILTCRASAFAADDSPAMGQFSFQWEEIGVGDLFSITKQEVTGGNSQTLRISDFTITPDTGNRQFRCKVTFTDMFRDVYDVSTEVTTVTLRNALEITQQPVDLDLTSLENNTGQISIDVEPISDTLPGVSHSYIWHINNEVINKTSGPGNTGYTFANWNTDTLTVTRTRDNTINYGITCEIVGGPCDEGLASEQAVLRGPSGGVVAPPPSLDPQGIGSYAFYTPFASHSAHTQGPGFAISSTPRGKMIQISWDGENITGYPGATWGSVSGVGAYLWTQPLPHNQSSYTGEWRINAIWRVMSTLRQYSEQSNTYPYVTPYTDTHLIVRVA